MNILFLTTAKIDGIERHAIYPDLLRYFRDMGHDIYTVSTYEKRFGKETEMIEDHGVHSLRVKTGNLSTSNLIEKGITTIRIEEQFKAAIKEFLGSVKFDLVMYSTPPITLVGVIKYVKSRDQAKSYLLLKDIFPQNAVDLGMMASSGVKGLLYRFFRRKEKKLYDVSDYIGCMSKANADYVVRHNPEIPKEKVEICPNSIEVIDARLNAEQKNDIRGKYGIPDDKTVFIYGGNLGRPQGIPFIIECLRANSGISDRYFVICGTGTEYPVLKKYIEAEKPKNVLLINGMPNDEYEKLVGCCDIGLIFLDHRFTIPNFPSRLLSYMQNSMPVLVCTDPNTDIGKVVSDGGFGWQCESDNPKHFTETANAAVNSELLEMGKNAREYLESHYDVKQGYEIIMRHFKA